MTGKIDINLQEPLCPDMKQAKPMNAHGRWRDDHTCAYCGSLSAAKFMEAVEAGARLVPTDKNYKAYIDTPGRPHREFYFQHLSKEACLKFIDLLREQKIAFAEPGHFYVMPYFIQIDRKEQD